MCSPNAEELTLLIAQQVVALRRVQGYLGQENSSDLRVLDNAIGICAMYVYTHTYVFTHHDKELDLQRALNFRVEGLG